MKDKNFLNLYTVIDGYRLGGRIETQSLFVINEIKEILIKNKVFFSYFESIYISGTYDIVFSKNKKIVNYLHLVSIKKLNTTNKILGKIFGYPICCINNAGLFEVLCKNNISSEIDLTLKNTKTFYFPYYMNIFVDRYRLIFHTPCSLDCKNTKNMAYDYSKILEKHLTNKEFLEYKKKLVGKFKGKYYFTTSNYEN